MVRKRVFVSHSARLGLLAAWAVTCWQPVLAQGNPDFVRGRLLVKFRPEVTAEQAPAFVAGFQARISGELPRIGVQMIELPPQASERVYLNAFKARPEVAFAELDRIVPPADVTPNDPWYPNEWHLPKISAPAAWSTTTGSSIITIAILDTGVDGTHEDLVSKMVSGWNFYDNNSDTADVYGHGTKVAGAAAAAGNNGKGVASLAWGCWIMPIRVSATNGYATYSAIANGITWAADHGARVANVSYRVTTSSTVSAAAQYFHSKGGVVVVSAGNESTFDSSADNPYILTVSATDPNDALYSWSNTGNNIDVAAPGCVYSTTRGGGYTSACGTSFSAPIVAGVTALVLSNNPGLTAAQVTSILQQSADDRGAAGWDPSYGWGRVNAAKAVVMAGGGTADTQPPVVSLLSPANGAVVSGTITIQVAASDNVGATSVSIAVDGALLCTLAAAPYSCSWNTTTAANGTHTLTATAKDAAGNAATASITVTLNNAADTTPPVIAITSPVSGSTVSGNLSVLVKATDNVGVVKVALYVDGSLSAASTTAPFTTKWNSRKAARGPHTLQTKAYDAAGNMGSSAPVTVYN
jgi:hypothetical protein